MTISNVAIALVLVLALIAGAILPLNSRWVFETANHSSEESEDPSGPRAAVTQVEWSRDGRRLLARSNGSRFGMGALATCEFDPETAPRLRWTGCRQTSRAAFAADGAGVLFGNVDGAVRCLALDSAEVKILANLPSGEWITAIAVTRDGETAAWGTNRGTVLLIDRGETTARRSLNVGPALACCIAFSEDGRRLVSASPYGGIQVWDVQNRVRMQAFPGHDGALQEVVFLDNGQCLLSCGWDGTLRRWDVASGQEVWRGGRPGESAMYSLAIAPDETLAVTAQADGQIVFWDISSRCVLDEVFAHRGAVLTARFSPDGAWLASTGLDGFILVWDVADRSIQAEIDLRREN